jgi:hypothetical protein
MRELLGLLERNGIRARPVLVQIKLQSIRLGILTWNILRGGMAPFKKIVESIVDYARASGDLSR